MLAYRLIVITNLLLTPQLFSCVLRSLRLHTIPVEKYILLLPKNMSNAILILTLGQPLKVCHAGRKPRANR